MVSKYIQALKDDKIVLWISVGLLCILSFMTTVAAQHADKAASRAEAALQLERDNSDVLDALTQLNLESEDRSIAAAQAVVGYIRCLALVPRPDPAQPIAQRDLIPLLDECARQAGLEPGPNPSVTPTTSTTRPTR